MSEPSGAQWCARFPTSTSLDDLVPPFGDRVKAFISALERAGATVTVSATYRPPERAYLMHWACKIAGYTDKDTHIHVQIPPDQALAMPGVDIDWTHGGDTVAARKAAAAMVDGYDIAFPAALHSNHTRKRAVDMTVVWSGTKTFTDFGGNQHAVAFDPNEVANGLIRVGETFGVLKLLSDPPHWSSDGH